jgi:hypothetical protein
VQIGSISLVEATPFGRFSRSKSLGGNGEKRKAAEESHESGSDNEGDI